ELPKSFRQEPAHVRLAVDDAHVRRDPPSPKSAVPGPGKPRLAHGRNHGRHAQRKTRHYTNESGDFQTETANKPGKAGVTEGSGSVYPGRQYQKIGLSHPPHPGTRVKKTPPPPPGPAPAKSLQPPRPANYRGQHYPAINHVCAQMGPTGEEQRIIMSDPVRP